MTAQYPSILRMSGPGRLDPQAIVNGAGTPIVVVWRRRPEVSGGAELADDLSPVDARQLARLLLSAADEAESMAEALKAGGWKPPAPERLPRLYIVTPSKTTFMECLRLIQRDKGPRDGRHVTSARDLRGVRLEGDDAIFTAADAKNLSDYAEIKEVIEWAKR